MHAQSARCTRELTLYRRPPSPRCSFFTNSTRRTCRSRQHNGPKRCPQNNHRSAMCRTRSGANRLSRCRRQTHSTDTHAMPFTSRASAHQQDATPTRRLSTAQNRAHMLKRSHSRMRHESKNTCTYDSHRCTYMLTFKGLPRAIRELCIEHLLALPAVVPPNTMQCPRSDRSSLAVVRRMEKAVILPPES